MRCLVSIFVLLPLLVLSVAGCTHESPPQPTTSSSASTNPDPRTEREVATRVLQAVDDGDVTTLRQFAIGEIPAEQSTRLVEVGRDCTIDLGTLQIVDSGVTGLMKRFAARAQCADGSYQVGTTLNAARSLRSRWQVMPEWLPGGARSTAVNTNGFRPEIASLPPLP